MVIMSLAEANVIDCLVLQEARSTQIKCKALDAKYQNVLAQVDDMVRAPVFSLWL